MKRMPSKPLLGRPVAVGMSAAVMAMRSVLSASAGLAASTQAAAVKANARQVLI